MTLTGGTLALGSANTIGSSGTISFDGGTLQYSASNTTDYSARFSNSANQACSIDTGRHTVTLGTALTSTGGSLTKIGNGRLKLSGAGTHTGATAVSAGGLSMRVANALPASSAVTVSSGALLTLNVFDQTVGSLAGAGDVRPGNTAALTAGGVVYNTSADVYPTPAPEPGAALGVAAAGVGLAGWVRRRRG
jgi:fibronectin-binding autotransporter adhesin